MKLTQPIKWHGGKHYLAPWVIGHMPDHQNYVEPYFGGGAVLLAKDPEGINEVVNDIDDELMNFWAVLADPSYFEPFRRLVESTPFSESIFEEVDTAAYRKYAEGQVIVAAYRFFIRARMSRQGLLKDFATLSRGRTRRGMNEQVSAWLSAVDGLPDIHARLRRVAITRRPALDLIRQMDHEDTLFYLDPPYLHETRVTTNDYRFEMTEAQHEELLKALSGIKGKFLLSGYDNALYRTSALCHGWRCETKETPNNASSAETKEIKTECLWMNF